MIFEVDSLRPINSGAQMTQAESGIVGGEGEGAVPGCLELNMTFQNICKIQGFFSLGVLETSFHQEPPWI